MPPEENDVMLNAQQVSRYLRISLSTVHYLTRTGRLKSVKEGKHWRYRKKDIDAYLERNFENILNPKKFAGPEKRLARRVSCFIPGHAEVAPLHGLEWRGRADVLNLSEGGALFEASGLLVVRDLDYRQASVSMRMPEDAGPGGSLLLQGVVVRLESSARPRLAVQFAEPVPGVFQKLGLEQGA